MSDELIAGLGGALLGAVIAGVFAWLLHRSEQVSANKLELRSTISKLIDYRDELSGRIMQIADLQPREAATRSLLSKRMIEMENAAALMQRIGEQISSAEYLTLANKYMLDSDFTAAQKYYERGLGAARSDLTKVYALRSIATYYFSPEPQQNINKGRGYFEKAAEVLSAPKDDYSRYSQGYTYECWGSYEMVSGFRKLADDKFDQAKGYYQSMASTYPLRQQALDSMGVHISALAGEDSAAPPSPVKSPVQIDHLLQEGRKTAP